jgi:hypothetical protein
MSEYTEYDTIICPECERELNVEHGEELHACQYCGLIGCEKCMLYDIGGYGYFCNRDCKDRFYEEGEENVP